jgi:hypothetical protein
VEPLLEHIRLIWCDDDTNAYEYLMNWMAHLVQRPWVKMGVCPVINGSYGTGKGIVVQKLGGIIGKRHFQDVGDIDDVVGRFNASDMGAPVLLFIDEGAWGGDRKIGGKLRKLVTESTHRVEKKFMSKYTVDSYCNFVFASNEDWVVPCDIGERRWFMLRSRDTHGGGQTPDTERYFSRLGAVRPDWLAHYLYERDLSTFNPQAFPPTRARQQQVERSMASVARWWNTRLCEGWDCFSAEGDPVVGWPVGVRLVKAYVYRTYSDDTVHGKESEVHFWRKFKEMAPLDFVRPRGQPPSVRFASLDECKAKFRAFVRMPDWTFE